MSVHSQSRTTIFVISLMVAATWTACSGGSFINKVVIINPTAYDSRVDIAAGSGAGWTSLTTVAAHSQVVVQDVYDEGPTWVFRFSYVHFQRELRMTRSDLQHNGWRVSIPASFGSELKASGVTPPPS